VAPSTGETIYKRRGFQADEIVQSKLPEGATVIPIIIASDKTHLTTQQGCKEAWPVYLSLGNIPKSTRQRVKSHSTLLIGYLPVTKLKIFNKDERGDQVGFEIYYYLNTDVYVGYGLVLGLRCRLGLWL
jgi:hypothetical protein